MPAYLSSEMRRALHKLAQTRPPFGLFIGPKLIPMGTAKALERRRIVRIEGTMVHLTDAGRMLADEVFAEGKRLLREAEANPS